ncbi:hypothetical protein EB001_18010 [bacterium]|nr:hypothetical protein [bacterium]
MASLSSNKKSNAVSSDQQSNAVSSDQQSNAVSSDQQSNTVSSHLKLIIVTDVTGSMGNTLIAILQANLAFMIQMSLVFNQSNESNIRFATIGDYDAGSQNSKEGGLIIQPPNQGLTETLEFVRKTHILGNGGGPAEAYKTAINAVLRLLQEGVESDGRIPVLILICDDIPHGLNKDGLPIHFDTEGVIEHKTLQSKGMITDWNQLCEAVKSAGIHVITIITGNHSKCRKVWQQIGSTIIIHRNTPEIIEKSLFSLFYSLIGQPIAKQYQECPSFTFSDDITALTSIDLTSALKRANPDSVIRAFETLLERGAPDDALRITSNPIMGKFWRLVCGMYKYVEDSIYAQRCEQIMGKFSAAKSRLSADKQEIINTWLEMSNRDNDAIRYIIAKSLVSGISTSNLKLPETFVSSIDQKSLLALGREGKYKELCDIILHLYITTECCELPQDKNADINFVPMNIDSDSAFFGLIANLIAPGLMFSRNDSLMLAILALNNQYLNSRAYSYLHANVGKWIKWTRDENGKQQFPQFWSLNFMVLLTLVPDELLTTEELQFRNKYLSYAKIIRNHKSVISVVTPLVINTMRIGRTWKHQCKDCTQKRCFTLFPGSSDTCIMCIIAPNFPGDKDLSNTAKLCEKDDSMTNWVQCSSCTVNYAVICTHRLNVKPKCNGCRSGTPLPFVECRSCLHKYVSLDSSAQRALNCALLSESNPSKRAAIQSAIDADEFICPRCVDSPGSMIHEKEVTIEKLINDNPTLQQMIPVTDYNILMDNSMKLWLRVLHCKESKSAVAPNILTMNGYKVHDPEQVSQLAVTQLLEHSGFEICSTCVSEQPVHQLTASCGECHVRMCETCITSWYGQTKRGHIVQHSHCTCPFCKGIPKYNAIRRLDLYQVRNLRPTKRNAGIVCEWRPDTMYGLCMTCCYLKPALARECARNDIPDITNFVCQDCHASSLLGAAQSVDSIEIKTCPVCTIQVYKDGGCNHITCRCGVHWCWTCCSATNSNGELFDDESIYDHLVQCGGIFA